MPQITLRELGKYLEGRGYLSGMIRFAEEPYPFPGRRLYKDANIWSESNDVMFCIPYLLDNKSAQIGRRPLHKTLAVGKVKCLSQMAKITLLKKIKLEVNDYSVSFLKPGGKGYQEYAELMGL